MLFSIVSCHLVLHLLITTFMQQDQKSQGVVSVTTLNLFLEMS